MFLNNQLKYDGSDHMSGAIPVGNPDALNTLANALGARHIPVVP